MTIMHSHANSYNNHSNHNNYNNYNDYNNYNKYSNYNTSKHHILEADAFAADRCRRFGGS